jgi:hypothetical protein
MRKFVLLALLFMPPAAAEEPKHVNPPVVVEGETVTMNIDFWKHTVDTMNWQAGKINQLQTENLLLKATLKEKCDCPKNKL